jgi:hypothetical protein
MLLAGQQERGRSVPARPVSTSGASHQRGQSPAADPVGKSAAGA